MGRTLLTAAVLIASAASTAADNGFGFKYAGEGCDSYDDDTVYTAKACGNYDTGACASNCPEGGWCYEICGSGNTSCANGGGAICATIALSNIQESCMIVEAYNFTLPSNETWTDDDDGYTAPTGNGSHVHSNNLPLTDDAASSSASEADSEADSEEIQPKPSSKDGTDGDHESLRMPNAIDPTSERKLQLSGGDDDNIKYSATGCDAHVYCEYCDSTKCNKCMHSYAKTLWGIAKWNYNYDESGAGPMAMKLLDDLPSLCMLVYPEGATMAYEAEQAAKGQGSTTTTTTTQSTQDNIRNMKHIAGETDDDVKGGGSSKTESVKTGLKGAGSGSKQDLELAQTPGGPGKSGNVAPTKATTVGDVDGWSTDDHTPGGTTTHHDDDESCGKGCTETVRDDDTVYNGDPTMVVSDDAPTTVATSADEAGSIGHMAKVNAPDARLPDGAVQASPEEPAPLMPDMDMAAAESGSTGPSGSSSAGLAGAAVLAVAGVALVAFFVQRRRGFSQLPAGNDDVVYGAI